MTVSALSWWRLCSLRFWSAPKSAAVGHENSSIWDLTCSTASSVNLTALLHRCRNGLIAVGLFSMGINLLVLTVSIYMLQVYDRVLPGRSVETLIYLTIIATGALATMGALDLLRSRILVRLGIWIDRSLSARALWPWIGERVARLTLPH